MFGCLTASHNSLMLCFELSTKPGVAKERFCPLASPSTGFSSTSTATADVIRGSKAVTPKTNLLKYKFMRN